MYIAKELLRSLCHRKETLNKIQNQMLKKFHCFKKFGQKLILSTRSIQKGLSLDSNIQILIASGLLNLAFGTFTGRQSCKHKQNGALT